MQNYTATSRKSDMKSPSTTKRHWSNKFRNAFRGLRVGIRGQSSFYVHFVITALVIVLGVFLRVSPLEWCVLLLCIGSVTSAELFNSAFESLAKAVTREFDDDVRNALDIASAAVLIPAIIAALVGASIFLFRFGLWLGWWGGYSM